MCKVEPDFLLRSTVSRLKTLDAFGVEGFVERFEFLLLQLSLTSDEPSPTMLMTCLEDNVESPLKDKGTMSAVFTAFRQLPLPASHDPLELSRLFKKSCERDRLSRQRKKVPALVVKPDPKPKAKVTPGPGVPESAIAIAAAAALAANKAKSDVLKGKPCFAFQK